MISSTDIQNNLNKLNSMYNNPANASDVLLLQFYSKLALIEFGGWIEESIDIILNEYLDRKILDNGLKTNIKEIINNNFGFKYKKNIIKLFCTVVGSDNWENIVDAIGMTNSTLFESIADNYSGLRNNVAHSHTKGTTPTYTSPSVVLRDYSKMWSALQAIEAQVTAL